MGEAVPKPSYPKPLRFRAGAFIGTGTRPENLGAGRGGTPGSDRWEWRGFASAGRARPRPELPHRNRRHRLSALSLPKSKAEMGPPMV